MGAWEIELWNSEGVTFITDEKERRNNLRPSILLFETLLILVIFNSSSYFGTTTYARSMDSIGIALTIFLLFWIWTNSRFRFGYGMTDLGLTISSVSRNQWKIVFAIASLLYVVAFAIELIYPSEVEGEVTLVRLFFVALFSLTFGPVFEELLFRGYLFKRSQDVLHFKAVFRMSVASIFSGLVFGLWHFPTPLILLYFNDPIIQVYENLLVFVLSASVMGIFLGEVRRRTKSVIPGAFLHFCANFIYVIIIATRLF